MSSITCRACRPAAKSLRKRLAKGLQTRRALSQIAATSTSTPPAPLATQSASRTELIRLLQDLSALLESATGKGRQIAFSAHDGGVEEEQEWRTRLQYALEDLQAAKARKTKVIILSDSYQQAADISLALLDDPLSSDQTAYETLNARQVRNGSTSLSYASSTLQEGNKLAVASPWLKEANIEIQELVHQDTNAPLPPSVWTAIHRADIVLLASTPQRKSDLARLSRKANVFQLQSRLGSTASASYTKVLAPPDASPSGLQSMPLDVAQALEANTLLRSTEPYMGSAMQKTSDFSSLLLSSGIPQLREVLTTISTALPSTKGTSVQDRTALQLATSLLASLGSSLADAKSFLHDASAELGQLELRAARDKRHSQIELGFTDMGYMDLQELVADHPQTSEQHAKKQQETNAKQDTEPAKDVVLLEDGKRDVEDALEGKKSRLHWWKLPFGRADDIAPELANALVSYFGGLERKLIFETGRLSERSLALSQLVDGLFKPPATFTQRPEHAVSLYSATLQNSLMSLSPTTQFGFPPPSHPSPLNLRQTSLTQPITDRKKQLISPGGPIEKLQRRAQSAVFQFYGISGGAGALSVFLSQTPMPELSVDLPTAIGVGLLGSVTALWRLQGRWKRSKKAFWEDWKRAQEGLSYDLQTNADHILEQKVFIKADTARHLLRQQLKERSAGLADIEKRLKQYSAASAQLQAP